jgi:phospholipid/cholesterol/gamma-HCH transport system substrate-binding protein
MAERGLRLKLGLFVAGALAILAGLVIFFGRAPDLFSNKVRYAVLFPEAPGIGPGTPIRKSGVRIGEVTSLDLDADSGQVRVQFRIDRKFLPRKSEDAYISRGLLSGDTAIDFLQRVGDDGQPIPRGEEWPAGSDIPGIPPITPRSLLTPASGVLANAQQSLDRIVKAFERLERLQGVQPKLERALDEASEAFKAIRGIVPDAKKTLEKIQNFIGSDDPRPNRLGPIVPAGFAGGGQPAPPPGDQGNLRALVIDLQDLTRTVRPAVDDFRQMMRRLEPEITGTVKAARQTFDGVNDLLSPENRKLFIELIRNANAVAVAVVRTTDSLGALLDSAEKTVKNINAQVTAAGVVIGDIRAVTKPLAAKSEALVANVTDAADQLSKTLTEVRGLIQTFSKGNGSIQKLLSDPTVYQNLDEAAASLARIMSRAEKIGRDLEVFADKIARRPELIGVGGAVRPSSGLKESPNAPLPGYHPDWPPSSSARPGSTPNWLPATPNSDPPPVKGYPPR